MAPRALTPEKINQINSVWQSPGFIATLIAVAAAFGSYALLLPVIPLAVVDAGESESLAGSATGVFMAATVLTQILTPTMLRAMGYNPVMVGSAFMLGFPALGHLLGLDPWNVLGFSALRGVGFGALTVAQSALIAELVPLRWLGKASGLLGVAVGLSQMLFLPIGLSVSRNFGFHVVYLLAAAVALISALMCLSIPRLRPTPPTTPSQYQHMDEQEVPPPATWKLITVPALAVTSLSMTFGAVSSFLPIAVNQVDPVSGSIIGGLMLSILGASMMVFRFLSGMVADRRGMPGLTMIPSQLASLLGTLLIAAVLAWNWPLWLLVLAAVLFGGAFGMVQNEALLSMFFRLPRSRVSDASTLWNISYDAGTGIGSVLLGVVAASLSYSGAYTLGAAIIALGLVITIADHVVGRHRITEHSNMRARLRQVPVARKAVYGVRKARRVATRPVEVTKLLVRRPPRPGWKNRGAVTPPNQDEG
ncbi:MFS transporter [Corynebacterium poyangense]|uniref:MFS transporter n=1 Tax=Corynebacterium poyangense TaxID=2684405 RepID=A0A7H0SPP1_9CORY|nr:MFS transporter [Corynebacterium poyangense]MBZ8178103.1 MFS transporter [Corynebacterium poyangense]QNQ90516.1 MFS transporter [Corynebacterium poyangense]